MYKYEISALPLDIYTRESTFVLVHKSTLFSYPLNVNSLTKVFHTFICTESNK